MPKFISKLCKENEEEACMDCFSTECACYCHKGNENWNDDFEETKESFQD